MARSSKINKRYLFSIFLITFLLLTSGCVSLSKEEDEIINEFNEIKEKVKFSICFETERIIDGNNLTIIIEIKNNYDKTINDDLEHNLIMKVYIKPMDNNMIFIDITSKTSPSIKLNISDDFEDKLSILPHSSGALILSQKINSYEIRNQLMNQKEDLIIRNLFGNYSVYISIFAYTIQVGYDDNTRSYSPIFTSELIFELIENNINK